MNEMIEENENVGVFNPVMKSLMSPRDTIRFVLENESRKYYWILMYLLGFTKSMDNYAKRAYDIDVSVIVLLPMFAIISGIIYVYFTSWVMSWFGKLFGGVATLEHLRISMLWSSVPEMLILPIALVTFIGGADNLEYLVLGNFIATVLYCILAVIEIVIGIWCFVNLVRMVSEVQEFSNGKAFLSIILPKLILIALMIVLFFRTG
ncbi:Yip1 family protein [Vallitalea sediminicola]